MLGVTAYFYKSSQEVKAIRRAFLSEIRSLSEMIRVRQYVEGLLESAAELDQGVHGDNAQISLEVPLDLSTYRPIWGHYASRIGSLSDPEAEQIHRFYQLVDSVARDVSPGGILHAGTADSSDFKDAAELLQSALSIADQLCDKK
ncbi:hypothetical protein PSMEN_06025 [Ectopseudomonas mendocina]|nr:hypothetical protein PSMEN_06025 [Pseudomonas mendocina]